MMFQIPFPPPPDMHIDPPGPAFQLFACIISVLLWFETVVFVLPERLRNKIYDLQFGPAWAAKRRERP
jgi:hypothetical protein